MITLIGLFLGALLGVIIAKRRQGTLLDQLQYAAGFAIILFLTSLFISIYINYNESILYNFLYIVLNICGLE